MTRAGIRTHDRSMKAADREVAEIGLLPYVNGTSARYCRVNTFVQLDSSSAVLLSRVCPLRRTLFHIRTVSASQEGRCFLPLQFGRFSPPSGADVWQGR